MARSFIARGVEVGSGLPSSSGNGAPHLYLNIDSGILYARGEGDSGWLPIVGSVSGVASGYKIARGQAALDGSNPTNVAHGLTTCVSFVAMLKGTAAPGDNTSVLTANINGANVDVYAWKNTGGTDPTLVASTGTESFYWIAVGV